MYAKQPLTFALIFSLLCLATAPLCQAEDTVLNGQFADKTDNWYLTNRVGDKPQIVDASDNNEIAKAVKITVNKAAPKKPYLAAVNQSLATYIAKDSPITFSFMAKGTSGANLIAAIQTNGKPYKAFAHSGRIQLTEQWKRYTFNGKVTQDYTAGDLRILFNMGHANGTTYIADVSLDCPKTTLPPMDFPLNANDQFSREHYSHSIPRGKRAQSSFTGKGDDCYMTVKIVDPDPKKGWVVTHGQTINYAIPASTKLKLMVRARSKTPGAKFSIHFEGKERHKQRLISMTDIKPTDDWQWFEKTTTLKQAIGFREGRLITHLGYLEQEIDFDQIILKQIDE
ncbi:MAG: carbohydrate binding domain-containing protein [Phycisphaeraceae bacterium JB051]